MCNRAALGNENRALAPSGAVRGGSAGTVIVGRPCQAVQAGKMGGSISPSNVPEPGERLGSTQPGAGLGAAEPAAPASRPRAVREPVTISALSVSALSGQRLPERVAAGERSSREPVTISALSVSVLSGQLLADAIASTEPAARESVPPLRVTRSLAETVREGTAAASRPSPESHARAQSLCLERAAYEARHGRARDARAKRRVRGAEGAPGAERSSALRSLPARVALALGSLGGLALAGAAFANVPVTLHAPGVLRALDGVRAVEPALAGVVEEVLVQPGADVVPGQLVVRLDAAAQARRIEQREHELETTRRATQRAAQLDAASFAEWSLAVERQRTALARQRDLALAQREQRARRLENYRQAVAEGLAGASDERAAHDQLWLADGSVAALDEQLAALDVQLAERRHASQRREQERTLALEQSSASLAEARSRLVLSEVRSPVAGRVESLRVAPGAHVQPGTPLFTVAPASSAGLILAFVPSDAAHLVRDGMDAEVELGAAPARGVRARVTRRPGAAQATPAAIGSAAIGSALPHVTAGEPPEAFATVELMLLDEGGASSAAAPVRGEERVLVHLDAGERRWWQSKLGRWWFS